MNRPPPANPPWGFARPPGRDICALILRQFAAPEEAFGLFRTNSHWRAAVAAHFGPELRGWFAPRYWMFEWENVPDWVCVSYAIIRHILKRLYDRWIELDNKIKIVAQCEEHAVKHPKLGCKLRAKWKAERAAESRSFRHEKYGNIREQTDFVKHRREFERIHLYQHHQLKRAKLGSDDGG